MTSTQNPILILPLVFLQAFSIELFELPGTYLFREIRCEEYRQNALLPPSDEICRLPAVQKKYTTDLAIYMGLLSILAILVSSPYARLSDTRGRKLVIGIAAAITTIGEIWLVLCAALSPLRKPGFIYLAAVIKGLGGSYSVMKAAEMAIIAENSTVESRSFYLGLIMVMSMAAAALAPLISGTLVEGGHYVATFSVGLGSWIVHLLYLIVVIREPKQHAIEVAKTATIGSSETSLTSNAESVQVKTISSLIKGWSERLGKLFFEPLYIITSEPTLRLLGLVDFMMMLGIGAFVVLLVWSDGKFGLNPSEAGVIGATMSISRAFSILCILPLVKMTYSRYKRKPIELEIADSEPLLEALRSEEYEPSTAVLDEVTPNTSEYLNARVSREETLRAQAARKFSVAQDLLICRICFFLDTLGMVLVSMSRSPAQVSIAVAIGSLGAPAVPSLQTLTTMATPSKELGRVLAALSIIESVVLAVRTPLLFGIYNLTLDISSGVVWWCSSALLLLCAFVVHLLRPARFVSKDIE